MLITNYRIVFNQIFDLALVPNLFIICKRNVVFDYLIQIDFNFSWECAFYLLPPLKKKEKKEKLVARNEKIWIGQVSSPSYDVWPWANNFSDVQFPHL